MGSHKIRCHMPLLMCRGISVMEDEGSRRDHTAGFASTDGRWHHIAVTWTSDSGATKLYDNGRLAWQVRRGLHARRGHDTGCHFVERKYWTKQHGDEATIQLNKIVPSTTLRGLMEENGGEKDAGFGACRSRAARAN